MSKAKPNLAKTTHRCGIVFAIAVINVLLEAGAYATASERIVVAKQFVFMT